MMDPLDALNITHIAIILLMVAAFVMWTLPAPCVCKECLFHMAERRRAQEHQRELAHDTEHKGFGFHPDDPDRGNCHHEDCPRNRKV